MPVAMDDRPHVRGGGVRGPDEQCAEEQKRAEDQQRQAHLPARMLMTVAMT